MTRCLTNQPIRLRVNARQRRERKLAEQNWKALKTLPFRARFYQWIRNYTFKVADGIVASNIKKKKTSSIFRYFGVTQDPSFRHLSLLWWVPFDYMRVCVEGCSTSVEEERCSAHKTESISLLSRVGERVYGFFFGRRHVWIS